METLFSPLPEESSRLLDSLPALIDQVFPLPRKFRSGLPADVAELSRLLTSGRGDRNESYLGEPRFLSAYLRYFLPWNCCRLARLLPALTLPFGVRKVQRNSPRSNTDGISLGNADDVSSGNEAIAITDLGSGPLTLPMALWISRPELRELPLEFRCLDRTGPVLEAGKKLFAALAGKDTPWRIKTIKASLGDPIRFPKANLVTAVNLFNELFWKIPQVDHRTLAGFTGKNARLLSSLALEQGSILVVEPGVPRCGEFISLLRTTFAETGRLPLAPCPHGEPCPVPGDQVGARWCHFAFDSGDAPADLRRLSEAAGLPKERAALSFLLAGPVSAAPEPAVKVTETPGLETEKLTLRIISDQFSLSGGGAWGRYGCSSRGLVLVSGKKQETEGLESGTLISLAVRGPERRDGKSGALVLQL
ncbi:small ribosomal subunit Rsm22 family [Treponema primitia ZAS-2]|uniref:Small ribosomal subunit Rsm22 family n=1 Tax=Treponema primitia (strain ATCC BAA-887 / DSM 12427 / ZAS-2) TaxID=545694 RepID=F5YLP5_TREPZ|nr:small ribosomal subunit Rsm22 family protein [Treponema primitia]AEF86583.1 small ribosomal subunit Rsm22 family [Treponema primitia ZAS-2]